MEHRRLSASRRASGLRARDYPSRSVHVILHGGEFRCVRHVALARRKAGDELSQIADAIGRRRVGAEKRGDADRAFSAHQFLKETDQTPGIISSGPEILSGEFIGLSFGASTEFEEESRQSIPGAGSDPLAHWSSQEDERDRPQGEEFVLGQIFQRVAGGHMGDLMRHDSGQLGLRIGRLEDAEIDVEKASRQGERVHLIRGDDLDGQRDPNVRMESEILADPIDIFGDDRIPDQGNLEIDLGGELLAQGLLSLQRIKIELMTINIAPANE